jgi:hypothetical protein
MTDVTRLLNALEHGDQHMTGRLAAALHVTTQVAYHGSLLNAGGIYSRAKMWLGRQKERRLILRAG